MPLIEWKDSYSVGVSKCDEDHKQLFSMLNGLHQSMSVGHAQGLILPIVEKMGAYAETHFRREEGMMQASGFPGLQAHRAEHRAFLGKVTKLQQDMRHEAVNVHEISRFLLTWLSGHIMKVDRMYGPHLNAHGVR